MTASCRAGKNVVPDEGSANVKRFVIEASCARGNCRPHLVCKVEKERRRPSIGLWSKSTLIGPMSRLFNLRGRRQRLLACAERQYGHTPLVAPGPRLTLENYDCFLTRSFVQRDIAHPGARMQNQLRLRLSRHTVVAPRCLYCNPSYALSAEHRRNRREPYDDRRSTACSAKTKFCSEL